MDRFYKESTPLRVPRVPRWRSVSPQEDSSTDYYTKDGCEHLCKIIVQAWRTAGYDNVTANPIRVPRQGAERIISYTVETNLFNGLPPKR